MGVLLSHARYRAGVPAVAGKVGSIAPGERPLETPLGGFLGRDYQGIGHVSLVH